MFDGLVTGRLLAEPVERTSRAGKPYVTARLRVPINGGDVILVSVVCFDEQLCETMLNLQGGEAVSLAGSLSPKVWMKDGVPHASVDMVVWRALALYRVVEDEP